MCISVCQQFYPLQIECIGMNIQDYSLYFNWFWDDLIYSIYSKYVWNYNPVVAVCVWSARSAACWAQWQRGFTFTFFSKPPRRAIQLLGEGEVVGEVPSVKRCEGTMWRYVKYEDVESVSQQIARTTGDLGRFIGRVCGQSKLGMRSKLGGDTKKNLLPKLGSYLASKLEVTTEQLRSELASCWRRKFSGTRRCYHGS